MPTSLSFYLTRDMATSKDCCQCRHISSPICQVK